MPRRSPQGRFRDLVEAATGVFLAQGYRRTQMSDVAAALGVAKGTVYLYVESKEALFDAVLRHADAPAPLELPAPLPLPTPPPGATLRYVEQRIAEEASLPALGAALGRRRCADVAGELEGILRELFQKLSGRRVVIKLIDRCAHDHPELAALWYKAGREGALALLGRYLELRKRQLRRYADPSVAARIVLETLVFWAVHRHWDPSPQELDEASAEQTVLRFLLAALVKE